MWVVVFFPLIAWGLRYGWGGERDWGFFWNLGMIWCVLVFDITFFGGRNEMKLDEMEVRMSGGMEGRVREVCCGGLNDVIISVYS